MSDGVKHPLWIFVTNLHRNQSGSVSNFPTNRTEHLIYSFFRGLCRKNLVTPVNVGIEISEQQLSYDPALGLNQHLVSFLWIFWHKYSIWNTKHIYCVWKEFISVTTGFIGIFLFNLIVFLTGFFGTLLEDFNIRVVPSLTWQLAIAVTPSIWITRNKKIMEKIKNAF